MKKAIKYELALIMEKGKPDKIGITKMDQMLKKLEKVVGGKIIHVSHKQKF